MKLPCDAAPLLAFVELVQCAPEVIHGPVNLGDVPTELVRVEVDDRAARAGEVLVRLWPP